MPRNKVQFQKGLSEATFEELYGTEEKCRAVLFAWRWAAGFVCPRCAGVRYCVTKQRDLYQCNACHAQTSLISGTTFASTKLRLRIWFRAMYLMTQTKQGISRLALSRRIGVCYDTAWKIHRKLAQAMMERDAGKPLEGRVEMDDAYLGGERSGGKRGRGSPGCDRKRFPGHLCLLDDIDALETRKEGAVTVFAPPPVEAEAVKSETLAARQRNRAKEPEAVKAWRARMATSEARAVTERRGGIERINAQAKNRGLGVMLVRTLRKVQAVAVLHAIAHNLATVWRLRAANAVLA